jgi:transposase-like protein
MESSQFQRWTARRKAEVVMQLIRRERTLVDVCRENDLKQSDVEGWVETFQKSGERGLKVNSDEESAAREREIKELRAKTYELVLEIDARKKLEALTGRQETSF